MKKEDISKYKDLFLTEAKAYTATMNAMLLELEKNPNNEPSFREIFRTAHTLKSLASTMDYKQIAKVNHAIEDILQCIRNKTVTIEQSSDILFESFDFLDASLKELSAEKPELDASLILPKLHLLITSVNQAALPNEDLKIVESPTERIRTIDVKVERLDSLLNLSEELLVSRLKLELLSENIINPELTTAVYALSRLITDIQYTIMQVRLVPISYVFNRFQRLVRDLAKQQNKKIDLQLEGGDIELDRVQIEGLAESLAHLLKNAVDHGIETPEERIRNNKPPKAIIRLQAKRTKEFVTIEISDDGQGLDLVEIKKEAIKHNLLPTSATNEELMDLIFTGISTTKKVTSISGRGLGLAIVKQKIESLGGEISVTSILQKSTTFHILLPLTLTVIRVLFVRVAGKIYAIPLNNIERLLTIPKQNIQGIIHNEAFIFSDENIPLVRLSDVFNEKRVLSDYQPIVVVHKGDRRIGLAVDALLTTQEVVIKPLGKIFKENKYFSGSALIGSGEVILILDISHLELSQRQTEFLENKQ